GNLQPSTFNTQFNFQRGQRSLSVETLNVSSVRFLGSEYLLMHANWGHERTRKRALTPSPSPIRWERVAARPGEGRFMESKHLLMHANWGHEPGHSAFENRQSKIRVSLLTSAPTRGISAQKRFPQCRPRRRLDAGGFRWAAVSRARPSSVFPAGSG